MITPGILIPLFDQRISCGFAHLLDEHQHQGLSLDQWLIKKPAATYFLKASGDSMSPGIMDGDLLIVDKSLTARSGDVVIAMTHEGFFCKRLYLRDGDFILSADNSAYAPVRFSPPAHLGTFSGLSLELWGVVTAVVRTLQRPKTEK